ncbi:hypothetical protein BD560DRAFT_356603, partial [Blakeslea trispora]
MTSTPYNTLDSLLFDSESNLPNSLELEDSLELWTNAEFKHDKVDKSTCSSPESITNTPSVTYEHLSNYLNYELPQNQLSWQKNKPLLPKISSNMTIEEVNRALLLTSNLFNSSYILPSPSLPPSPPSPKQKAQIKKDPTEEEKRKRNTAASARFRIKKKQREQTMERTVKEMTEKSASLESRVKELELEIKFLRNLLIEKKSS